jgi:hypothetical protein
MICADYGDRDSLDTVDTNLIANVGQRGWGVLMIGADDTSPGWAFTVGLWHTHRSPELAMFGLDIHDMMACLNTLGDQVRDGHPVAAGQERDDIIEGYPVALKPFDDGWRKTFLGTAIGFYRATRQVPFLQVLWPDREGRFPDREGCTAAYLAAQPHTWIAPADHPAGCWTQQV